MQIHLTSLPGGRDPSRALPQEPLRFRWRVGPYRTERTPPETCQGHEAHGEAT